MPRRACPCGRIEAFPGKQTLCGVSVSDARHRGRAGSQEHLPGASSLCLVHVAMAGWRGQQPREVEQDTNNITTVSNPTAVPCQIACYPKA